MDTTFQVTVTKQGPSIFIGVSALHSKGLLVTAEPLGAKIGVYSPPGTPSQSGLYVSGPAIDYHDQEVIFADGPAELTAALVRQFAQHHDADEANKMAGDFVQALAFEYPHIGIPLQGAGVFV